MKRLTTLLLTLIMAFTFEACASSNGSSKTSSDAAVKGSSSDSLLNSSSETSSSGDAGESLPYAGNRSELDQATVIYLEKRRDSMVEATYDPDNMDHIIHKLWWLANTAYNVDEDSFSEGAEPPEGAPEWASTCRFYDYNGLMSCIFTENGLAQLESCTIGGGPYIYKADGEVYHMGPWKTGVFYENALEDYELLSSTDTERVYLMRYGLPEKISEPDGPKVYSQVEFTIQNVDEKWLVERYESPAAKYESIS